MIKFIPRFAVAALPCLLFVVSCSDPSSKPVTWSGEKVIESRQLRGFGTVEAVFRETTQGSSLLEISAESEEKAQLILAKYLSDLKVTPGVNPNKLQIGGKSVPLWVVSGQGAIAAARSGSKVFIAAALTNTGIEDVLPGGMGTNWAKAVFDPEVTVPMWLDRWDQFGFRFYYRPWEKPKDKAMAENYDYSKEFEFAEQSDRSGFVFWSGPEQTDTAEGLRNDPWWDWAARAAEARKLPVGLNIMGGGPGFGWFYNRFREQEAQKMPDYCGTYHGIADSHHGGSGFTSWNSTTAEDAMMGNLLPIVKKMASTGTLTTVLEPHGELRHGDYDVFMEYGDVADATFRPYLEKKYKTIEALNAAWGSSYKDWSEVKVPEVATFLGWGPNAIELGGAWKIAQEPGFDPQKKTPANAQPEPSKAPAEWFGELFDDTAWPVVMAPGHDRTMFLPKQPAVYRRTIDITPEWLQKNPKVWIYLWDLNTAYNQPVQIYINGVKAAEDLCKHPSPHWMAAEIAKYLKPGRNQISLRLPSGYLAYKVYLSGSAPIQYPALGKEANARWVDFVSWIGWSRVHTAQRGVEMIRQATPDVQIDLMAPDFYADGVKEIAQMYGGNFKNTGYMGGFWADYLPAQMRGADFPFSLEPGGPASDLPGFKKQMGLYHTEGLQGVDYFIHVGNIMWNSDIRGHFQQTLPMIRFIGKYHAPKADTAFLWATRNKALTGFPWGNDPNTNLPSGWNCKGIGDTLLANGYPRDGLSESDFENGNASRYKVIIDTNTSILDEDMVRRIEDYVRGGGTFVTFAQTGRHTPTQPDSWPISRLTGYEVLSTDKPAPGSPTPGSPNQPLSPVPGQDIYPELDEWMQSPHITGLRMKKVADDAQDLLMWKDGTVAAGVRKIGEGQIIQLGARANGAVWLGLDTKAFQRILDWRGVTKIPAHITDPALLKDLIMRHYVSNNGLYDVWVIFNQSDKTPAKATIQFDNAALTEALELENNTFVPITDGKLTDLAFDPLQTRLFLTPRNQIALAPLRWFELQRNWWRGTTPPPDKELPAPPHKFSLDLGADWAFRPLTEGEDGTAFSGTDVDDASWEKMPLSVWSLPDKTEIKRAILRKSFTVPATWSEGDIDLWIQSWQQSTFIDKGRVWLDGKLIRDWNSAGLAGVNPDGVLKAGTSHVLAVEIEGKDALVGSRGTAWLWHWPKPEAIIDLAGEWSPSTDAMNYTAPIKLPGNYNAFTLRRNVFIPSVHSSKNVLLDVSGEGPNLGVLINGRWMRRLHHIIGTRYQLNLTPWIKFGAENEIELIRLNGSGPAKISSVDLRFYPTEQYP